MKNKIDESFFNQVTDSMLKNKNIFGAVLCVQNEENTISWVRGVGNIQENDTYFIASVTKLYVTAILLRLRVENRIQFEDKMDKYLPEHLISGLHVLNGVDYTKEITITHLISNTSGIPDYFSHKQSSDNAAASDLFQGKDESWTLEKALERAKSIKPKFKPGQTGKVSYSDTNYQLLGAIIEKITGKKIGEVFQEYIFDPLDLPNTYAYNDINDDRPVPMYYKSKPLHIPHYMASITAEGGIISTAEETMIFLKAFANGYFCSKETLNELHKWHLIFFPGQFYYGLGLEKLWVPRFLSPFKPIKDILGFWGQSGAFAFYNPQNGLYFTGTVNQTNGLGHNAAYHAIIKILKSV